LTPTTGIIAIFDTFDTQKRDLFSQIYQIGYQISEFWSISGEGNLPTRPTSSNTQSWQIITTVGPVRSGKLGHIWGIMRKVHTHRLNGQKYHIGVDGPFLGICDKPGIPGPKDYSAIRLSRGLPYGNEKGARDGLITLIHECLHAENWDKCDRIIDRTACDIGRLLWRLGFRRGK